MLQALKLCTIADACPMAAVKSMTQSRPAMSANIVYHSSVRLALNLRWSRFRLAIYTAMLLCEYERMVPWIYELADQHLFKTLEGGAARLPKHRRSVSAWATMH